MSNVLIIIPCGQGKIWDKQSKLGSVRAKDAYTGAPFKVNRAYAEHFANHWLILSAKYGFISPDFLISEPYNVTFKKQSTKPVSVPILREQVKSLKLYDFDTIIGLGGIEYRSMIEQAFIGYSVKIYFPFAGLSLGFAMQATRNAIRLNNFGVKEDNKIRNSEGETLALKERSVKKNHSENINFPGKEADQSNSADIEIIWAKIENCQGEIFRQIRGGEFTYVIRGNTVLPDRTNVQISKGYFEEALQYYPLTSTMKIQHLRGPSYIFAILMDKRIY
jgi:hypothetical protein